MFGENIQLKERIVCVRGTASTKTALTHERI